MKQLNLLSLALIALMVSACGSVSTRRNPSQDKVYLPAKINSRELSLPTNNNLSDMIQSVNEYESFFRRYQSDSEEIMSAFNRGEFSWGEFLIKNLVRRLEHDSSEYAPPYKEKIKNFSYIVYENSQVIQKRKGVNVGGLFMLGLGIAAFVVCPPSALATSAAGSSALLVPIGGTIVGAGGAFSLINQGVVTKKELSKFVFDKIRVQPYYGRREIIQRNIPGEVLANELGIK